MRALRSTRFLALSILVLTGTALTADPARAQGGEQGVQVTQDTTRAREAGGVLPGDRVRLGIWNEPMMSDTFHVGERGEVVLPKLGPVEVEGMMPLTVGDRIRQSYDEYLRNPAVDVTVLRRIGVLGEVREPTVYWLDVTMSVRDAIAMAGGVTPEGDQDDITLVREGRRLELDVEESAALVDAGLRSGDQIVVGRKNWFRLNAPYVISSGISLLSLVTSIVLSQ